MEILIGVWQSPENGWRDSEYGPVRSILTFRTDSIVEHELIISDDSPGGGGLIKNCGKFHITAGNTVVSDVFSGGVQITILCPDRLRLDSNGEKWDFVRRKG